MNIGILSHPSFLKHLTGAGHPEKPERLQAIQHAIDTYPFKSELKYYNAPMASKEDLKLAHDEAYIEWIFSIAPADEAIAIDEDTVMGPQTLTAALHAVGAVKKAVDLVVKQEIQAAFCNVRPPGHHAEREKAMGFCFFNNVAVGALYAMKKYHFERVLIVDFDVHHGNGTQSIFQKNKSVMLCSSFEHPLFPGYDNEMDNNHILNLPLAAGSDGSSYKEMVKSLWLPRIKSFAPEMIFFSAGFDGHKDDPLSTLAWTKKDYQWITKEIVKLAKKYAKGRVISVLEGGYNLEALRESVPIHIDALI